MTTPSTSSGSRRTRTSSRRAPAQTRTLNRTLRMRSWRVRPPVHTWVFFDKYEKAQLGVSYTSGGKITARVRGPSTSQGSWSPRVRTVRCRPRDCAQAALHHPHEHQLSINEKLNVGATIDHYRWHECCGDEDGDILPSRSRTSKAMRWAPAMTKFRCRCRRTSTRQAPVGRHEHPLCGYQTNANLWLGGRLGYNQNAVPDYAVSATTSTSRMLGSSLVPATLW